MMNSKIFLSLLGVIFCGFLWAASSVKAHEGHDDVADLMVPAEITAEILQIKPLAKGENGSFVLSLKNPDGGFPVMVEQLEITHTKPIHIFVIDRSLTDFQHIHPRVARAPGEYLFGMVPQTDCGYKMWVSIKPQLMDTQILPLDLDGKEECEAPSVSEMAQSLRVEDERNIFELKLETPLKAHEHGSFILHVTDKNTDEDYAFLEPVLGAFAHAVGFSYDLKTMAHIHPEGDAPQSFTDRAGPLMKFHITPQQSGLLKLFVQLRIHGSEVIIPFAVDVE